MKYLALILLIPFFAGAQTVHVDDNNIVYKGGAKLGKVDRPEAYARAQRALASLVSNRIVQDDERHEALRSEGSLPLASPYHLIKTLHYNIELKVAEGEYRYRIDSVYLSIKERGGKTRNLSSEELLRGMDVSGEVASNTEAQLNEIDMSLEKLIDLIEAAMKKPRR